MLTSKNTPTQPNSVVYFQPEYPPLQKDLMGEAAVNGQIIQYPQIVRKMIDPPIEGQKCGNLSFMLLDTPRIFRGKPIYGYVNCEEIMNLKTCVIMKHEIVRK
jgi:hypothetical protein